MQDVQKLHDGRVVQLLQQADLPELNAGYALIRVLDLDLLERDSLKKRIYDKITKDDMNSNCRIILSLYNTCAPH